MLINITDLNASLCHLFSERCKFKKVSNDPTPTGLRSLQSFLRRLLKRGELNDEIYRQIFPQNAHIARAHSGLPKIHKQFYKLPKFRPIIDTIGSSHYSVGQFLAKLLNPLTHNEFVLKDSFDAADRIRNITPSLLEYHSFVSFDVVSLFTNVPLKRTIDIICKRIYDDKLVNTTLKNNTIKKLIRDTCTKTAFLCNGNIYEQVDGVSMDSPLAPVVSLKN